jgi:hypothetical protein
LSCRTHHGDARKARALLEAKYCELKEVQEGQRPLPGNYAFGYAEIFRLYGLSNHAVLIEQRAAPSLDGFANNVLQSFNLGSFKDGRLSLTGESVSAGDVDKKPARVSQARDFVAAETKLIEEIKRADLLPERFFRYFEQLALRKAQVEFRSFVEALEPKPTNELLEKLTAIWDLNSQPSDIGLKADALLRKFLRLPAPGDSSNGQFGLQDNIKLELVTSFWEGATRLGELLKTEGADANASKPDNEIFKLLWRMRDDIASLFCLQGPGLSSELSSLVDPHLAQKLVENKRYTDFLFIKDLSKRSENLIASASAPYRSVCYDSARERKMDEFRSYLLTGERDNNPQILNELSELAPRMVPILKCEVMYAIYQLIFHIPPSEEIVARVIKFTDTILTKYPHVDQSGIKALHEEFQKAVRIKR